MHRTKFYIFNEWQVYLLLNFSDVFVSVFPILIFGKMKTHYDKFCFSRQETHTHT